MLCNLFVDNYVNENFKLYTITQKIKNRDTTNTKTISV